MIYEVKVQMHLLKLADRDALAMIRSLGAPPRWGSRGITRRSKNYGPEVNLFVDHSQIVQLACLRAGIWGTKSLWGRVVTYRELTVDS
jgi:hypothetical protein